MESLNNSPLWLALLQILVVVGNAYLFARQKSRGDVEKRDVDGFRLDLSSALQMAQEAKRDVQTISIVHYEALRCKYETLIIELRDAQARINGHEETIASLNNKLASRERADKGIEKKAAKEAAAEAKESQLDLDEIIRANGMPLNQPPVSGPVHTGFGKAAKAR